MKRGLFVIISLSIISFFSGGVWTYLFSEDASREAYKNFGLFTKVYDIVKKNYVEEPKDDNLVQGSIRGMLESLDPHSVYMTKEEFAEMQADTRGQFGGLGIEIAKKNGMLTVISPIEDTPAFQAGIKAGDIIAKIMDQPTDKLSIFDAVKLMRGKPGTTVEIWIRREGVDKLLNFKVKRAVISVKSVTSKVVDGFGVVKIKQFLEHSADEMQKALKQLSKEAPLKGLVLDLRNNPGGLLQQAVEVVDTFIDKGLIVYTQGRDKVQFDKKFAVAKGTEPFYPIVVLVNGGSASASEIVSGALQDHKRAHVMGTQTFGKGSVQNVIPLEDGSGIKLTVALYYLPSGRTIQGLGITPDKIVKALDEADALLKEKDLPGHIIGHDEKKGELENPAAAKSEPKKEKKIDTKGMTALEKEDFQLAKAIDYLKEKIKLADSDPKKETAPVKK
ncbi:MAG: S41 family peptidase [Deltaproteobacteria bacterium]|nr:S41 family peptidase [Deltaproteobacteria bacterium]